MQIESTLPLLDSVTSDPLHFVWWKPLSLTYHRHRYSPYTWYLMYQRDIWGALSSPLQMDPWWHSNFCNWWHHWFLSESASPPSDPVTDDILVMAHTRTSSSIEEQPSLGCPFSVLLILPDGILFFLFYWKDLKDWIHDLMKSWIQSFKRVSFTKIQFLSQKPVGLERKNPVGIKERKKPVGITERNVLSRVGVLYWIDWMDEWNNRWKR